MLDRSYPTLPPAWYFDAGQYRRELEAIFERNWLCVGRESEWPAPGDWQARELGRGPGGDMSRARFFVVRGEDGALRAFHNTCRHRGAELCSTAAGHFAAGRIVCPYHAWTYALDGRLADKPRRLARADFDATRFGLYEMSLECWRGFVFVHAGQAPARSVAAALGPEANAVAAWPLAELEIAHREYHEVACNWKVFWENYAECLHCPGVHPGLTRLVPLYREGYTDTADLAAVGRGEEIARLSGLREGAVTWSDSGLTGLPWFEGLGEREKAAGMSFCTLWPGLFLIAHVDYVRAVQVWPLGPERIRLEVTWMVGPGTRADRDFDVERLTAFARRVVMEDAAICEVNQRGLRCARHEAGVLMPQEHGVLAFDDWVRRQLGEPPLATG